MTLFVVLGLNPSVSWSAESCGGFISPGGDAVQKLARLCQETKLESYAKCYSALEDTYMTHENSITFTIEGFECRGFQSKRDQTEGFYILCTDPITMGFVPFDQVQTEQVKDDDGKLKQTIRKFHFKWKNGSEVSARADVAHFDMLESDVSFGFSTVGPKPEGYEVTFKSTWEPTDEKSFGDKIRSVITASYEDFVKTRKTEGEMMVIAAHLESQGKTDSNNSELIPQELSKPEPRIEALQVCASVADFKIDADNAITKFKNFK